MAPTDSPAEIPEGFELGVDIDISAWNGGELVIDVLGNVECYVGYRTENQPQDLAYYAPCAALRDKGGRESYRFVELRRGVLRTRGFLCDDQRYRVLEDRWTAFPRGADSDFGVKERGTRGEDVELTRVVFGATAREIRSVVTALSRVTGRASSGFDISRVTFSRSQSNRCDVSGCLIPKNFPYIAFEESQYDWSHVSLYGLYRLISFLCPDGSPSPVQQALLEEGVPEEVVHRLREAGMETRAPVPYLEG